MRERLSEWAMYFAAVGIALWAAAGILFLLGNQPNERLIALLVIGVLAFALYVYARPSEVRQAVTSREARYGSNALLVTVVFIGIVGVLNFLGSRYNQRIDTTVNQINTLSPLSIQAVKNLKEPVQATGFFVQGGGLNRQDVEDRLKLYAAVSDKFTYRLIDPQAAPQIANDYKVQFDGTLVLERGKRRENALQTDEQGITNAILHVSQDTQPAIYFTTGHGEHSPADSGDNGYSFMQQALTASNFKVDVINLLTVTDTLPSDISMLVIAGPRNAFSPEEANQVKAYLDKGGRALIMVDPQMPTGLEAALKDWGVEARGDAIFDPKFGFSGQLQTPVITQYGAHKITDDLVGEATFFSNARSLSRLTGAQSSRSASSLASTSDASWGETDFDSIKSQKAQFDVSKDTKGPLDLMLAIEDASAKARMVVIGTSSLVTNGSLRARAVTSGGQQITFGNGLLILNAVNWLGGQEDLIQIPPKTNQPQPVLLSAEQSSFVFWSSFLLVPLAILIVGALVWWRRR